MFSIARNFVPLTFVLYLILRKNGDLYGIRTRLNLYCDRVATTPSSPTGRKLKPMTGIKPATVTLQKSCTIVVLHRHLIIIPCFSMICLRNIFACDMLCHCLCFLICKLAIVRRSWDKLALGYPNYYCRNSHLYGPLSVEQAGSSTLQ